MSRLALAMAAATLAGCGTAPLPPSPREPAALRDEKLAREETFDFTTKTWGGPPPEGFVPTDSGAPGAPGRWITTGGDPPMEMVVEQCDTDATAGRFPMLVYEALSARDVDVWVRFATVSGRIDQAGGIAFRVQDRSNYYVARANALENDVRLFKVVAGERVQIAARDVEVATAKWHLLKVSARGSRIQVAMDGIPLLDAQDGTFDAPGRVGLWTKADSVTKFDALKIETFDRP